MHATTDLAPAGTLSPFKALVTMFYEPTRTFDALENRSAAWLPALVVIGAMCGMFAWYFSVVDFPWMQDRMLEAMPAENRDMARAGMSKNIMLYGTIFGMAVGIPMIAAIQALYLLLVSKVGNRPFSFGKGFALALWASMPAVLLLPIAAMQIMLANNGQLDIAQLNPLTLNQLVFQFPIGSKWAGLLEQMSVVMVWTMVLFVLGYQSWAKVSRATALKVILIPYAIVYGGWFLIALMSKGA